MPFCAATSRCCAATVSCFAANILLKDNRCIHIFLLLVVYNFELPIDVIFRLYLSRIFSAAPFDNWYIICINLTR
jgi:hypothetical protein